MGSANGALIAPLVKALQEQQSLLEKQIDDLLNKIEKTEP